MPHKVFYSWQSDLPNSTNRGFIQTALEKAIKSLQNSDSFVIDRDTMGVGGSPDIAQTIFHKIQDSQVFICDVSIINKQYINDIEGLRKIKNADSNYALRPTPNPNVLIELGYALALLGPEHIIMLMNQEFGGPELLPFDLRMRRVVTYSMPFEDSERAPERKKLEQHILLGLQTILEGLDGEMPGEIVFPADEEIHSLISKVQSRSVSLSQTIANVLSIANKLGDDDLANFCKGELAGWEENKDIPESVLICRSVEGFLSYHQIDIRYHGWNNDMTNAWNYMEENPEEFKATVMRILQPISYCESFETGKCKALLSIKSKRGDYFPKEEKPEIPVYAYFQGRVLENIVEKIRIELTSRLLKLLERNK